MINPVEYSQPWLIVVEGVLDKIFFEKFLRFRNICGFEVHDPKDILLDDDRGGKDCFGECLEASKTQSALKGVLLVSDNDSDPSTSFRAVQSQIRKAELTEPSAPLSVTEQTNAPKVVVMMLPWTDETGCLESLCLPAAYAKWPGLNEPLNNYLIASPARTWQVSPQSKMLFRCLTAAGCERDPNAGIRVLYKPGCEFPLDHACFDRMATYLAGLQT